MPDERKIAALQHELHVWLARPESLSSQQLAERYDKLLNEEERQRSRRFHFEQDRWHFIAAHATLRLALANYLECAPQELQFVKGSNGKPQLQWTFAQAALRFNLSHTGGLVACVLALAHECGVDVEAIRPMKQLDGVAETVFSADELEYLARVGSDDASRLPAFFRLWTLKEAYIKATGLGMSAPLRKISIDPDRLTLKDPSRPEHEPKDWLFDSWTLSPGHAMALACNGAAAIATIKYHELDLADGGLQIIRTVEVNGTSV